MSQYVYVQAELHYPDPADYQKAVQVLNDGGWLEAHTDHILCDPEKSHITILQGYLRNLLRTAHWLTKNIQGWLIWGTTDGVEEVGYYRNGEEVACDLWEWAEENWDEFPGQPDEEDIEDYTDMQLQVIDKHFEIMSEQFASEPQP